MTLQFYMVDVFAEKQFSGNPLAVVVDENVLSDKTMQKIAAEINFSETAFVNPLPENNGGYRARIFTPSREIAFAGHPILGTAKILRDHIIQASCERVTLNLSNAQVPVSFELLDDRKETAWFLAPKISLGPTIEPASIANALNLSVDDIDMQSPVQVISASTAAIIVPLQSLDALRRSRLNLDTFSSLKEEGFPPLVYLFCNQTRDTNNDISVRFFFEAHGVREDPATGNGAAFFGAYLLEHKLFSGPVVSLRIEQGYEINRPSLIMLRAHMQNEKPEIAVGGYVVPTVCGELL